MEALTTDQVQRVCQELNRAYPAPGELAQALDDLLYSLFFIDMNSISQREQQNAAHTVLTIKRALFIS